MVSLPWRSGLFSTEVVCGPSRGHAYTARNLVVHTSHARLRNPVTVFVRMHAQVRDPHARALFRDRGYSDVGALSHGILAHEQAEEHVEGT